MTMFQMIVIWRNATIVDSWKIGMRFHELMIRGAQMEQLLAVQNVIRVRVLVATNLNKVYGESVKLTKDEKKYLAKVADLGCIICTRLGYKGTPAEIHHIRGMGLGMAVRSSHYDTLPLCPEHHRGKSGYHGMGRKAFERQYGTTEQQLLDQVKELLNEEN